MPHPNTLTGKCYKSSLNVCAFRGNFHLFLSSLGKTNMARDPDEYQYVAEPYRRSIHPVFSQNMSSSSSSSSKIFLYEVSQLQSDDDGSSKVDGNATTTGTSRELQFRRDLQHFLQLQQPLTTPMIWFKPGRARTAEFLVQVKKRQMDICHNEYTPLRTILQQQAYNASQWIRRFFIQHPDVTVSSPDYFANVILASWERDPCIERRQRQQQQQEQGQQLLPQPKQGNNSNKDTTVS
jgi:hypothetical protein